MSPTETSIPNWLTTELVQNALQEADGSGKSIKIVSMNIRNAVENGTNYASTLLRISVKLMDSSERRIIIKCNRANTAINELIPFANAFYIETSMYSSTLPAMVAQLPYNKRFSPSCLKSSIEGNVFIMMEDLTEEGFKLDGRGKGLSLEQCMLVVKKLAEFHGTSVALYERNPEVMAAYLKADGSYDKAIAEFMGPITETSFRTLARITEKFHDNSLDLPERLRSYSKTAWDTAISVIQQSPNRFYVLNHGDMWLLNFMFKYGNGTPIPEDVVFVDFQESRFTTPAYDLQHFLFTSPMDSVRSNYWHVLLSEYHSQLEETMSAVGCTTPPPSLQSLEEEMQRTLPYGLMASVVYLPGVIAPEGKGFDHSAMPPSGQEHTSDNNLILFKQPHYLETMQRILPIFTNKGLL